MTLLHVEHNGVSWTTAGSFVGTSFNSTAGWEVTTGSSLTAFVPGLTCLCTSSAWLKSRCDEASRRLEELPEPRPRRELFAGAPVCPDYLRTNHRMNGVKLYHRALGSSSAQTDGVEYELNTIDASLGSCVLHAVPVSSTRAPTSRSSRRRAARCTAAAGRCSGTVSWAAPRASAPSSGQAPAPSTMCQRATRRF